MEHSDVLVERITSLKAIAASMHDGAIHTEIIPEVDKILALPDETTRLSVSELEALTRQVREYEQTFDGMGYSFLEQIMPAATVSPVFKLVRAADVFKRTLKRKLGESALVPTEIASSIENSTTLSSVTLGSQEYEVLTRYNLSIGTPPVTDSMVELVGETLFASSIAQLRSLMTLLGDGSPDFSEVSEYLVRLITSSTHYCTGAEEEQFLRESTDFINFEGARLFNRIVITDSPDRVIKLIEHHLFDKFGEDSVSAVRSVSGHDRIGRALLEQMQRELNAVFLVRVTRLPHRLFDGDPMLLHKWRSVLGRLILIDDSVRARQTNTTLVFTLFPHAAKTLRALQTSFCGLPANTQLELRRLRERFPVERLRFFLSRIEAHLALLHTQGLPPRSIDSVRTQDWLRSGLNDYLSLIKLKRFFSFMVQVATLEDDERKHWASSLNKQVGKKWLRYFYRELDDAGYEHAIVPGGGRGALTIVGEYHRVTVREALQRFRREKLDACRAQLERLKQQSEIPVDSTDEIQAAIQHAELRELPPTLAPAVIDRTRASDYFTRTLFYRLAQGTGELTKQARAKVDHLAFRNFVGGAADAVKQSMSDAGFSALHGRLEALLNEPLGRVDRKVRGYVAPLQGAVRSAQRIVEDVIGEIDPVPISEIESVLKLIEQERFYPMLILPEMAWTYHDVFPEKHYPRLSTMQIPLNERFEMDSVALRQRLEQLRYLFRRFPELFEFLCQSMLLVINSPHNPTGVVYRRQTILELLQLAAEFNLTVVDDNAYHKIVTRRTKAREGDLSVAQLYEHHRTLFERPISIITVGSTTKGLQGAGDRTGLIVSRDPSMIAFAHAQSDEAHLLSLYFTELKLESGLAAKRYTQKLEALAPYLLDPTRNAAVIESLREVLVEELNEIHDERFPAKAFFVLLKGYEEYLRLHARASARRDLSQQIDNIVSSMKRLRFEKRLRDDVEQRLNQAKMAQLRALPEHEIIEPGGAFYLCVRLCAPNEDFGMQAFLETVCRYRKVDAIYAGQGFVRISLGGALKGSSASYDRLGVAVETYLKTLARYWEFYRHHQCDVAQLEQHFLDEKKNAFQEMLKDLWPLLHAHRDETLRRKGASIERSERGMVYVIEEGLSVADKVVIREHECQSVDDVLRSRSFRVMYRRLLKRVWRNHSALRELSFPQVEARYGPLSCRAAYEDRYRIDELFQWVIGELRRAWYGRECINVLAASLSVRGYEERIAALHGINQRIDLLIAELCHVFKVKVSLSSTETRDESSFSIGYETIPKISAATVLPPYLQELIRRVSFAGASTSLAPSPTYVTGAVKRVADYRYGFIRRDKPSTSTGTNPAIDFFQQRLTAFVEHSDLSHYVAKGVQVGPFRMLLLMHCSMLHLLNDEIRLFPQIELLQQQERLNDLDWDGVLLFGIPSKVFGDCYRSGYILERKLDGTLLPLAWVSREEETDYVGFLKKSLLTLHNERTKLIGGMPVHGAMITITFKNGLRKTLVFSADSGTGKSETITAMMEQLTRGVGPLAEVHHVDILAGDMLSLWRGEDQQLYAFGTETGDFMRLTDITESWKARFGDLLHKGSYSNLDYKKNPRVTIPGICDVRNVLAPTRVNGFFYINNYEAVVGSSVEIYDDPHHTLKHVLVRGLRKNKGTSGDQPSLRAGLEHRGEHDLVTRYRHEIDRLFTWQECDLGDGATKQLKTCLVYRDGIGDVFTAKAIIASAFVGKQFRHFDETPFEIAQVHYECLTNLFWLVSRDRRKTVLDRAAYDQIYEPLVSTFCGNPFVNPEGMEQTLELFAQTMRVAKVHTGVIKTQLAREGYEYSGPARAAEDIVRFLLGDEEVNARFQRNKDRVHQAMQRTFSGILEPGSNLPVELEGINLLRLEAHESRHVHFFDHHGMVVTLKTPFYQGPTTAARPSVEFVPTIVLPEIRWAIQDICNNLDYDISNVVELEMDLALYDGITFWSDREELIYQVLLVNGVINLGSPESAVARFPLEVRKAAQIADVIAQRRKEINATPSENSLGVAS